MRKNVGESIRKQANLIGLSLLIILCYIWSLSLSVHASDSQMEIIKVGYVNNYGTVKSPIVTGAEGYGYEYLNKIFDYAEGDYQLEFIEYTWGTGFEALETGEIDIFGPLSYSESNGEKYLYPEESVGEGSVFLATIEESAIFGSDYSILNGNSVAVIAGNYMNTFLYEFLEKYELSTTIVEADADAFQEEMEEYDCVYYLTSSYEMNSDAEMILSLGSTPLYYVTDIENQALIDVMNEGMAELERQEYLYEEELVLKYFDPDESKNNYISDENYILMQSKSIYYVGIKNLNSSICNRNEDGELEGFAIDVLDMIAEKLEIKIEYIEISDESDEKIYSAIDFYFLSPDEVDIVELKESEVYYEIPLLFVEHNYDSVGMEEVDKIGVISYYGIQGTMIENYALEKEIVEYDDVKDVRIAFNAGEIDAMVITTASLNMIRGELDDLEYYSTPMDSYLNLSFAFSESFSDEKIEIINKVIRTLDDTELEYSLLNHSSQDVGETEVVDFLKNHPEIIVLIAGVVVLLVIGISLRRRAMLSKLINYDSLTGLYSKYKFIEEVKKRLANTSHQQYSIVSIDIDNFKYINEIYGFQRGTDVLVEFSHYIKNQASKNSIVARSGADNFLFLVQQNKLEKILQHNIEEHTIFSRDMDTKIDENYRFTFSIGIYDIADTTLDINYMIDCTNIARGMGKKTSGTTVNKFTPRMEVTRKYNNEIVAKMNGAIEDREFVMYYQPKVNLKTGAIVEVEALVRWYNGNRFMAPNAFIPLFEKNGFIVRLDYYVLDSVCRFIQKNREMNLPKISINLSCITVMRADLVEQIMGIINQYNVLPTQIDLEITETAFVERFDEAIERIRTLRKLGFTISMDDFGAGISSLNRLKNIEIDTLKIDREFIVDSLRNPKGAGIIRSVIQMSKDIQANTVAEGIETEEQREFLIKSGCDLGQGFLFYRPLPEQEFLNALNQN